VNIPISAVYTPTASRLTVLAGQDHLTFQILDQHFQVSARSFFQVNTLMAEKLVQFLLEHLRLTPEMHVLELYAGVGLFSVFLAEKAGTLTAVESSGAACHDFALNLDTFENVTLYEADAAKALREIIKQEKKIQVLVMDPPRTGLSLKAHDALGEIMPDQIAYISCDPATLARDSKKLIQKGYKLLSVTPFDLFPQTYHIESLSIFERNESD
jgi:23S rRNA (uracil1939-C5)-methyltransferase